MLKNQDEDKRRKPKGNFELNLARILLGDIGPDLEVSVQVAAEGSGLVHLEVEELEFAAVVVVGEGHVVVWKEGGEVVPECSIHAAIEASGLWELTSGHWAA